MTSEIVKSDPAARVLREKLDEKWAANAPVLAIDEGPGHALASTIILAKRYGGTGTSTLALILEFLMRQEALIIEIGGNRCPALSNRGEGRHAHFSSHDEGRIEHAMDLRLAHPGRAAILEFEPALYTETLNIAAKMSELDAGFAPTIFYVCARHEWQPRYEKNAIARQIGQTFICHPAMRGLAAERQDGLHLPWLDRSITGALWTDSADLHDALAKCTGSWTLQETRHNLETFLKAILAR